jgi:hypothetical protein
MGVNRSFHRFNLFFSPSVSLTSPACLPSSKTDRGTEHCCCLYRSWSCGDVVEVTLRIRSIHLKRNGRRFAPAAGVHQAGNLPTLLSKQPFSGRRQPVPNNRPLLFPRNRDLPPYRLHSQGMSQPLGYRLRQNSPIPSSNGTDASRNSLNFEGMSPRNGQSKERRCQTSW